jgi:succinoglycan biosynthesis protein ExoM
VRIVEKRRGSSQAHNTGIASALDRADFLAFVLDDSVPEPEWLTELLRVQANRHADAVAGPCLPVFEVPPARWLERGGLFEQRRHTTGASIDHASGANVLASVQALAGMDALFDERMGSGEGSDAEFFRRFAGAGRRIVWADSARVHTWIPPQRATLGWLLRRAFRSGRAKSRVDRHGTWPRMGALPRLTRAVWTVAKGLILLPLAALLGRAAAARAVRLAVYGAGRLAGQLDIS